MSCDAQKFCAALKTETRTKNKWKALRGCMRHIRLVCKLEARTTCFGYRVCSTRAPNAPLSYRQTRRPWTRCWRRTAEPRGNKHSSDVRHWPSGSPLIGPTPMPGLLLPAHTAHGACVVLLSAHTAHSHTSRTTHKFSLSTQRETTPLTSRHRWVSRSAQPPSADFNVWGRADRSA